MLFSTIAEFSKPKQTATTRRWKVGVGVSGRAEVVRTKIEFSNRDSEGSYSLEPIPSSVVAPYFDLDLLLRRRPLAPGALDARVLTDAGDRALQLPYAAFRDQVLPFLEPDALELYEDEAAWEQMQTFVARQLEKAR